MKEKIVEKTIEWTDKHNALLITKRESVINDPDTGKPKKGAKNLRTLTEPLTLKEIRNALEQNQFQLTRFLREQSQLSEHIKAKDFKPSARVLQLKKDLETLEKLKNLEDAKNRLEMMKAEEGKAHDAIGMCKFALDERIKQLGEEANEDSTSDE